MHSKWLFAMLLLIGAPARAWELPADNATMPRAGVAEILSGNDYPETTSYRQAIDYIDFSANGQPFTQIVVTLTPDKPRLRNGRRTG